MFCKCPALPSAHCQDPVFTVLTATAVSVWVMCLAGDPEDDLACVPVLEVLFGSASIRVVTRVSSFSPVEFLKTDIELGVFLPILLRGAVFSSMVCYFILFLGV